MNILEILAIICMLLGIVGSILPGLPGPPVSWIGVLLVFLAKSEGRELPMTLTTLLVWLAVVIIVSVLDYLLPAKFTTWAGGHKEASTGAMVGLFAGLLLTPVGMIAGSLTGAFLGELMADGNQGIAAAFKAAIGAFIGFIATTGMKVITTLIMAWEVIDYIF